MQYNIIFGVLHRLSIYTRWCIIIILYSIYIEDYSQLDALEWMYNAHLFTCTGSIWIQNIVQQ